MDKELVKQAFKKKILREALEGDFGWKNLTGLGKQRAFEHVAMPGGVGALGGAIVGGSVNAEDNKERKRQGKKQKSSTKNVLVGALLGGLAGTGVGGKLVIDQFRRINKDRSKLRNAMDHLRDSLKDGAREWKKVIKKDYDELKDLAKPRGAIEKETQELLKDLPKNKGEFAKKFSKFKPSEYKEYIKNLKDDLDIGTRSVKREIERFADFTPSNKWRSSKPSAFWADRLKPEKKAPWHDSPWENFVKGVDENAVAGKIIDDIIGKNKDKWGTLKSWEQSQLKRKMKNHKSLYTIITKNVDDLNSHIGDAKRRMKSTFDDFFDDASGAFDDDDAWSNFHSKWDDYFGGGSRSRSKSRSSGSGYSSGGRRSYGGGAKATDDAVDLDALLSEFGTSKGSMKTQKDVQKAWKKAAIRNHPDKGGSTQKMQNINNSMDKLKNTTWYQTLDKA